MALYPAGIGTPQEALQATAAMRQEPWYQQLVSSFGQNPAGDANGDVKLTDDQQAQVLTAARDHGIGIPEGWHVNENGQIEQDSMGLGKKIAIGAGLAGLGLTGFGLAGIGPLAGALGAGGAAAGAGATDTVSPGIFSGIFGGGAAAAPEVAEGASVADPAIFGSLFTPGASGATSAVPGFGGLFAPSTASGVGAASPTLTDWLKTAKDIAGPLAASSAGRAQGRLLEGNANQQQARTALDLYNSELSAPRTIARNAVKGDILANAQDATVSAPSDIPVPTISGGLRPSMFSDATRQTGRNIATAAANTPIPSPAAPVLPDLPQAGALDSILNGASSIAGIAGATAPLWRKYLNL